MSKKFSSAQFSYFTWEQEILAVLEGLSKWEDKLMGRPITLVTDHKSLQFFTTQNRMSNRQVRWLEYISRFNFTVMYVPGEQNKVADALSQMYHNLLGPEGNRNNDWVSVDRKLDPEGEDLPHDVIAQARAMQLRPKDRTELRIEESKELNKLNADDNEDLSSDIEEDVAWSSGAPMQPLQVMIEGELLLNIIIPMYQEDKFLSKILDNPEHHDTFSVKNGVVYTRNPVGKDIICVPNALFKGRVTEIAIDQAH
jgi:RNase H-like domain found in reverse transcriptase